MMMVVVVVVCMVLPYCQAHRVHHDVDYPDPPMASPPGQMMTWRVTTVTMTTMTAPG